MNNAGETSSHASRHYVLLLHPCRDRAISQLTRIGRVSTVLCQLQRKPKERWPRGHAAVRFNWSVRLNWRFSAAGPSRSHTAKNGARCVSMRSDAMRRIRWLWSNGAVERKICGRKTSKRGLAGAVKSFRVVQGARGGKRQTSKFHMAPCLCYVLSFDSGTYSLTREPDRVHPIHVKFLLDLLTSCVRLESLSKAAISLDRFVRVLILNL